MDNVPITIALIPVIQGLGASGMNIAALWWALVFGAGFGGNGTIIGSTANIVVAIALRAHTHPDHLQAVEQTRPAGDAGDLRGCQPAVCLVLSNLRVKPCTFIIA